MTSYFEKLTSINTSSLSLLQQTTSKIGLPELENQLEELKQLNSKLELDLKCEHDEKNELVSLKVGLENEVLNLREVNDRLEFQVEQLKVEKDKIHNVLAKFRESSSWAAGSGSMKKLPSLDDLSLSQGGPLERITEEDETLLESLVLNQSSSATTEDLQSRILSLEQQNARLSNFICSRCSRQVARNQQAPGTSVIFGNEEETIMTTTVDDIDDGFGEDLGAKAAPVQDNIEQEIETIVQMQRKIIEKLESELNGSLEQQHWRENVRREVERMKRELEAKMGGIVRKVVEK